MNNPVNVLLLGANGQLGKSIFKRVNQFDEEHPEILWLGPSSKEVDICNIDTIESYVTGNNISIVVDCAAYTNVTNAENDKKVYEVNAEGTKNVATICSKYQLPIIYISTDYVYNGDKNLPLEENSSLHPVNKYGGSKMLGEQFVKTICAKNYIILRTQWMYSEFGNNFLTTVISKLDKNEEMNIVYDQIGTPTYAGDLADAIIKIVAEKKYIKKYNGIYNYSNLGTCSWYDFAKIIEMLNNYKNKNKQSLIKPILSDSYDSIVERPTYTVLNKSKFITKFNMEIPYWVDSLINCLMIMTLIKSE